MNTVKLQTGALGLLVLIGFFTMGATRSVRAELILLEEDLGNFPDAIAITAEFGTFTNLNINSTTINATGFLFHLSNTSYGDGFHSSFETDPDGDFATDDVLTEQAGNEIDAAQPLGIYSFGAGVPDGSGAVYSAPDGFVINLEQELEVSGLREINFVIDLADPDGLIFDPTAPVIPLIFTNPRTGTYDFFISTPDGFTFDQLPQVRNSPGLDIATEMAWVENGGVATEFYYISQEVRPRGELGPVPIPEPSSLVLVTCGLASLAGLSWRRRRRL